MFFIPIWVTNFVFLAAGWLSGFQLVQLRRVNPVPTLQFFMVWFCLAMVLIVVVYNRVNPWLSMGFLLVAVATLILMIRRHRLLPPTKPLK